MFELYQLRYFLAVVETGSFTKAAERACVTQPTLSAGIQKLESALGVKLFNRSNRRVFLTEAGVQFVERAKAILHQCTLAQRELTEVESPKVLRLGALMTVPAAILERLLRAFLEAEPGTIIELFEGTEQEIGNRLESGGIDVALTLVRGANADKATILFEEGYVVVVPASHPLAGERAVEGRAFANQPTIVRTRCEVLSETSRYFTAQNVRPRLVYRTAQDERALAMVAAGLGYTTVPESYRRDGAVQLRLLGFDYRRRIGLVRTAIPLGPERAALTEQFIGFAASQNWADATSLLHRAEG
ncbi:MAG: LysR family transcriptional regulator [Alphaproteobacteria bacterium]|nr:MAG: LysR family transcriptional regulator [Alphaproteobacteria bacterium]